MVMNSNSYKGNTSTHHLDLTAMNLPNWKETSYPPDRLWAWKVLEARIVELEGQAASQASGLEAASAAVVTFGARAEAAELQVCGLGYGHQDGT